MEIGLKFAANFHFDLMPSDIDLAICELPDWKIRWESAWRRVMYLAWGMPSVPLHAIAF